MLLPYPAVSLRPRNSPQQVLVRNVTITVQKRSASLAYVSAAHRGFGFDRVEEWRRVLSTRKMQEWIKGISLEMNDLSILSQCKMLS